MPVASLDRAPPGPEAIWADLPFDAERFAHLVDSGRVGGWVSSAPSVTLLLLEPPAETSLSEEDGVVKVSWTPPGLAGEPGVPLGFRVEMVDGPRWTMVVPGDQASTQIDYRGDEGRSVSTVSVATVLQVGKDEKGNGVFLSSPAVTASRFGLRGRQAMRLQLRPLGGGTSCSDGRPPRIELGGGCVDIPATVDPAGGFSFACDEPWHFLKLSGRRAPPATGSGSTGSFRSPGARETAVPTTTGNAGRWSARSPAKRG